MRKSLSLILLVLTAVISHPMPSHAQATYNLDRQSFTISTSGNSVTYPNIKGVLNFSIEEIFNGSPTSATVTVTGTMRGGTTQTIDIYTTTTATSAIRTITGLFDSISISATFSGGSSPSVKLNLYGSANSAPSILSYQYANIISNASTQVKSGAGFFHAFIISTKGATANQAVVFDNSSCTGTKIATIDTTAQGATYIYDVQFNTGLCILTQTGTAGDFTVSYR